MHCDVAIIGGGPAGSTCGTLLKKYAPHLNVVIFEREVFPRDHIGESQLPVICQVLEEMEAWDKVEAAGFPIKIGATYRWGATQDLWDFSFLRTEQFLDLPRPGKFEGQRRHTAFQVDRAVYDKILLDHAAEFGCDVRQNTRVQQVEAERDRVTKLVLDSGEEVTARHFVDASGVSSILRKKMRVDIECPTMLRNIAVWDYWQNADWMVQVGTGGTRILVMSLGYGWIWFIPIGPTRTSIGLVMPAEYYKSSGRKLEDMYAEALQSEPLIRSLMTNAASEGKFTTTNDWSYISDRLAGENWYLIGDACGFADPILSAGMSLAHIGGKHIAYTIMEIERGELDSQWLRESYSDRHRARIRQHIQFADYWYTANGCFADLRELTRNIARSAGLELNALDAFAWLSTGGFANDLAAVPMIGGYELGAVQQITQRFSQSKHQWRISGHNIFQLNLDGATEDKIPVALDGRIRQIRCLKRGEKTIPCSGLFGLMLETLSKEELLQAFAERLRMKFQLSGDFESPEQGMIMCLQTLETMVIDGWVTCSLDPSYPPLLMNTPEEGGAIHTNKDLLERMRELAAAGR